jgi:2-methylcitrate dehydratase PrpD
MAEGAYQRMPGDYKTTASAQTPTPDRSSLEGVATAPTVAEVLAEFAADLPFERIPAAVVESAKLHLLDTIGCGLAAYALGVGGEGSAVARRSGGGESTVIGSMEPVSAPAAGLANGMLCHALDFDDTHPDSICHIGTVVFPAGLAAAEAVEADGRTALTALIAGSEVVARIGRAAAGEYMVRGFHPTSVFGVFGAAAAAGRLFGWTADTIRRSLGLAGSMAGGLFEYLEDGSSAKVLHAGWAAHAGIMAADLAGYGASGPSTVIEGRFGVMRAFFGISADADAILDGLGERWATAELAFKPFPACHFIHGPIDAAAQATLGRSVRPNDIDEIIVVVPRPAVPLVLEPRQGKIAPRTSYDAKFSLQYSVAAMLSRGRIGVSDYVGDAIRDPTVLDLAARVTYRIKEFASFPSSLPGGVEIRLKSGEVLTSELAHQRGGSENPMLIEEIVAKFRANARLALPRVAVDRLERAVLSFEREESVSRALAPLREAVTSEL